MQIFSQAQIEFLRNLNLNIHIVLCICCMVVFVLAAIAEKGTKAHINCGLLYLVTGIGVVFTSYLGSALTLGFPEYFYFTDLRRLFSAQSVSTATLFGLSLLNGHLGVKALQRPRALNLNVGLNILGFLGCLAWSLSLVLRGLNLFAVHAAVQTLGHAVFYGIFLFFWKDGNARASGFCWRFFHSTNMIVSGTLLFRAALNGGGRLLLMPMSSVENRILVGNALLIFAVVLQSGLIAMWLLRYRRSLKGSYVV